MMNEDGRAERLEARVADLEREVQRLSGVVFGGRMPAPPPEPARTAAPPPPAAHPAAPPSAYPQPAMPPPPPPGASLVPGMAAAVSAKPARTPTSFEGLIAGRGLQITGALLVLLGCAFFLDLAITRGWIGPAERILLGLATGAALVGFSSRIGKPEYRAIGEALIGLGAGILYLSLWASLRIAELHVAHVAVFAAMIAVTAALGALSATRRSQATAVFGALGGLLTPVLLAGGPADRVVLAAYVLVLSVAMLGLAARYAFGSLDIIAIVGVFAYAAQFAPDPAAGWTDTNAAIVATLFFLVFAIAVSLGNTSGADRRRRVTILTIATASYALVLELIFAEERVIRGVSQLVLSAALLAAARIRPLDRAITRTYGYLALCAITLAVASLIQGTVLIEALTIEAGIVFYVGRRVNDRWLQGGAASLLALIGTLDVLRDWFLEKEYALELALSSAVWLGAAGYLLYVLRDAKLSAGMKSLLAVARVCFDFVAVIGLSRVCFDLFGTGSGAWLDANITSRGEVAISILWTLYGSGLFLYGLRRKTALLRWEGLTLLGVTVLKVFSVDLASVDVEWRVLSSIVLGAILIATSALYVRSVNRAAAATPAPAPAAPAE